MKKQLLFVMLCGLLCGEVRAQSVADAPVTAPVTALAAETIELRPRWQAGKKYLQTMRSNMRNSQTIDKQLMAMTQDMTIGMLYEIKSVDAQGAAQAEITYRSLRMDMQMGYGGQKNKIVYDSQKPPKKPDPATAGLAALVGLKFQVKLSPEGRLLDIRGLNAMRDRIIKATPLPPGMERAFFESMMKKQLSDEAMRKMIEQKSGLSNTDVFPGKPVAVGESWTRKITLEAPLPLTSSATYTLRERNNGIALLGTSANFAMSSDNPSPVKEVKSSTKMTGYQKGTIEVRESDGQIMKMQSALRFSGTVTATGPEVPNSRKIITKKWPIYMAGTVSLESKDLP